MTTIEDDPEVTKDHEELKELLRRRWCPECGSKDTLPIVFGYPDDKLGELAGLGLVVLGGCIVSGEDPTHTCRECHAAWRLIELRLDIRETTKDYDTLNVHKRDAHTDIK